MPRLSRRHFLWITGGSGLALATDAPRKMVNRLIPQVIPAENIRPGEWNSIATTCRECPAGCGMLAWHRDGRVTKVEGNPQHPVNRGSLCSRGQSSVQGLYDPDRLKAVMRGRNRTGHVAASWNQALGSIAGRIAAGDRLLMLSNLQTGALAEVMTSFCASGTSPRPLWYEPFNYEPLVTAHRQLFGKAAIPAHVIGTCDLVVSFAADFLETWISPVSYASQYGTLRAFDAQQGKTALGRFTYVGPRLSMTAANADEFVQVAPGGEALVAAALVRIIAQTGWARRDLSPVAPLVDLLTQGHSLPAGVDEKTVTELARRFASAGRAVALAGPTGAAGGRATRTALAVALLNYLTGRIGDTVDFSRVHALSHTASENDLLRFFGTIGPRDIVFIHEANPLYSRPGVASHLQRAGTIVFMGTMFSETARMADWVLPIDSPLESWGEYEPETGIEGLLQPCLGRLYDTRHPGDILMDLAQRAGRPLKRGRSGQTPADFPSWLRQSWDERYPGTSAERFWKSSLRSGGAWNRKPRPVQVNLSAGTSAPLPPTATPAEERRGDEAELWLWPPITLFDGRLSNRGWMQEAPDPITFFVWSCWIDVHPRQAAGLGLKEGDLAEVSTQWGAVRAPVRVSEEVANGAVAFPFGQGHTAFGSNADGVGANAFILHGPGAGESVFGRCRIRKVAGHRPHDPIVTAPSRRQYEREILQWVPLSELQRMKPGEGEKLIMPLAEGYRPGEDIYPPRGYRQHRWAMVVDLQRCIGCGACSVACYAENNIPVVGKEMVGDGREMAWLRVAPYHMEGKKTRLGWLPMLCQHCDAAPCEPVCPVYAALHNEEGLNAQIYNRCIGTRYCSNNCPYKVRRFNWINSVWRKPLDLQLNPEVTVRSRGVMEKCTFCVQRIRLAEYRAAIENRPVRDGEIQTACMQTCPTGVYTFGDLLDPHSQVSRLMRNDPRRYQVLKELNTKPAVVYLRRVDVNG